MMFMVFFLLVIGTPTVQAIEESSIDLSGAWRFRLDPDDQGITESWFNSSLPDSMVLPGSLNENGIGNEVTPDTGWTGTLTSPMWHKEERFAPYREPGHTKILFWLQPDKHYIGAAWYQREVEIPDAWSGKHISLYLERCHWETQLWVDGQDMGMRNSLSTPHAYDVAAVMTPGKHTLTLRVDNRYKIEVGVNAHSVSDNTQTNWNGIIGAMRLDARERVHIADVQVYPNLAQKTVQVAVGVNNVSGEAVSGKCIIAVKNELNTFPPMETSVVLEQGENNFRISYFMGEDVLLWNEHHPHLHLLEAVIETACCREKQSVAFGMRELGRQGTQFTVNDQLVYLRGTLECAIFPKTGYPPMQEEGWRKIFTAAKDHGLNHLRFHSWCPPEAAFAVADKMGFMLHVEGPFWTGVGDGKPVDAYIYEECDRILKTYGNHPSFCFLAYGNEPNGARHERFLSDLVTYWKNTDGRRLYTAAAGWPMIEANQYHVTYKPRVHVGGREGVRFRTQPFASTSDYRDFVKQWSVPVVSHEIGQWCVFPNLAEMTKYTGPLKPRNFEIVRDMLEQQGMLHLAKDFCMASGKLQTICYKEEIEAALRTPGFGGFQLLDLHDFPGQGTALVGMLDPFWESKGYVDAEMFRQFCGPTVPLVRMTSCIYASGDVFRGAAEVTHFGDGPLTHALIQWTLKDRAGKQVRASDLKQQTIPVGSAIALGDIIFDFAGIPAPEQLKLAVNVAGYENSWDIWLYPDRSASSVPDDVTICSRWDQKTLRMLEAGKKVLLLPEPGSVAPSRFGPVPAGFPPIFWNTFWFPSQELRTLGILLDPEHPLFAKFPTEFHSNWQWWNLTTHAQVMSLDGLPQTLTPLVRVIDDWNTCRRLGLVFEARVAAGKVLVCGADIENDWDAHPDVRQFRESLLAYMMSDAFNPAENVQASALDAVFQTPRAWFKLKPRITASSAESGYGAEKAMDGNKDTFWHTRWEGTKPEDYPHWIRLEFREPIVIAGLKITPRQDMTNGRMGRYQVYVGDTADRRGKMVAHGSMDAGENEKTILFDAPQSGGMMMLRALGPACEGHPWATLAELDIIVGEEVASK